MLGGTMSGFFTAVYDWTAQTLASAPLAVQVAVVLVVTLPLAAVAAIVVLRCVDFVAQRIRLVYGVAGGAPRAGGDDRAGTSLRGRVAGKTTRMDL